MEPFDQSAPIISIVHFLGAVVWSGGTLGHLIIGSGFPAEPRRLEERIEMLGRLTINLSIPGMLLCVISGVLLAMATETNQLILTAKGVLTLMAAGATLVSQHTLQKTLAMVEYRNENLKWEHEAARELVIFRGVTFATATGLLGATLVGLLSR